MLLVINQTAMTTGNPASYANDNCTDCNSWTFALNGMIADQRPFVSGNLDKAWIFFTLPETILITKVKVFTNEVNEIIFNLLLLFSAVNIITC